MFLQKTLADPKISFALKNVLVTGANTGLGFAAATKFASLDASKVILGCRDLTKAEHAKSIIEEKTGRKDQIQVWPLDLNSYDSIQEFARRVSALDHLDVVIMNAGIYSVAFEKSKYGWEQTLQTNVISTTLLALLLLPLLRASRKESHYPLLEFVSSRRAEQITFNEFQLLYGHMLKTFSDPSAFKASQQYQVSKLFLFCIMERLAEIVSKYSKSHDYPDVIVTSVCPGFCQSDLSRSHTGLLAGALRTAMNLSVLRSTEEGSRSLVSGVNQGIQSHGKMWYDDKIGSPPLQGSQIQEGFDIREKIFDEVLDALAQDIPDMDTIIEPLKG